MTDKELLELAAKAAGIEYDFCRPELGGCQIRKPFVSGFWNPLTDDGDALRLAVKLGLKTSVGYDIGLVFCRPSESDEHEVWEPLGKNDPYAATRRAITRAAAEIGKAMP
jgi:hypothetical protein